MHMISCEATRWDAITKTRAINLDFSKSRIFVNNIQVVSDSNAIMF